MGALRRAGWLTNPRGPWSREDTPRPRFGPGSKRGSWMGRIPWGKRAAKSCRQSGRWGCGRLPTTACPRSPERRNLWAGASPPATADRQTGNTPAIRETSFTSSQASMGLGKATHVLPPATASCANSTPRRPSTAIRVSSISYRNRPNLAPDSAFETGRKNIAPRLARTYRFPNVSVANRDES